MRRKICTLITTLTVLSFIAYGQSHDVKTGTNHETEKLFHNHSFIEVQTLFASKLEGLEVDNGLNVHYSMYETVHTKTGFGVIAWRSHEEKYFTMGAATRFKLFKGQMEILACAGLEKSEIPVRGILSFHFTNHRNTFTCHASVEKGGLDWYYGANISFKLNDSFDAGIHTQRFMITGPWLVYKPANTISVWLAAGVDPEHTFAYEESSSKRHLQWEIAFGLRCNLFGGKH